jgi:signal transduction histidine kinase
MDEIKSLGGQVLERLACAVIVHDDQARAIIANEEAALLLGRAASAILGLRPGEYLAAEPEAARVVEERLARAQREGRVSDRHPFHLGTAGAERTVCDWPFTVRDPDTGVTLGAVLFEDATGVEHVEHELRQRLLDLQDRLHDHDVELNALRELQVRSEKMAALGDLLAGVAHEINTPLGAVNSNHDIFVRAVAKLRDTADSLDGEARAAIERFLGVVEELNRVNSDAIQRMVKIVGGLRNFARREEPVLEEVNIHDRIDDSLALIHHQAKNRIDVVREYGTDVPPIRCYASLLSQVFLNVLVNAVHAIDGKGRITIRTSRTDAGIRIDFTDTGRGIPRENLERVFEPGFTTKDRGQGTGLGLSISRHIVERHGGRMEVASELGGGCTFSIILPLESPEAA